MKRLSVLLAVSLIAGTLFTACGKPEEPVASSAPTQESSVTNTGDENTAPPSASESAPVEENKDWSKAYDNFFKDYKFFDDGMTLDLFSYNYNQDFSVRMIMSTLGEDTSMTMEMASNDGTSSGFTVCKVGDYSYLYCDLSSQMQEGANPEDYILWVKTLNNENTSSVGTFDKDDFGLDKDEAIKATYEYEEIIDDTIYDVLKYVEERADITDEDGDSAPITQYYYIDRETQKLKMVESSTQDSSSTIYFTPITEIDFPANIEDAKEVGTEEYAMDTFVAMLSMASGGMNSDDDGNFDWDLDSDFDWDSDWDVTDDSDLDLDWDIDWDEDFNFTMEEAE